MKKRHSVKLPHCFILDSETPSRNCLAMLADAKLGSLVQSFTAPRSFPPSNE